MLLIKKSVAGGPLMGHSQQGLTSSGEMCFNIPKQFFMGLENLENAWWEKGNFWKWKFMKVENRIENQERLKHD